MFNLLIHHLFLFANQIPEQGIKQPCPQRSTVVHLEGLGVEQELAHHELDPH